ncbi:MAG: type II toxin-antitoxin system Phd/YefM family antitoxin [Chlorobiaceae bacterium]|nr:type II toxin-antitoxin system Phd/YefM family antitoxin [Chlorobiaceae bacterium]
MNTITVTSARAELYKLVENAVTGHEPVIIKGKRGNAVLLSESDWNAVSETLHLVSITGMRESIQEGLKEEIAECSKITEW